MTNGERSFELGYLEDDGSIDWQQPTTRAAIIERQVERGASPEAVGELLDWAEQCPHNSIGVSARTRLNDFAVVRVAV